MSRSNDDALVSGLPVPTLDGSFAPTRDAISQGIVAVTLVGLFVMLALEKAHRVLVAAAATGLLMLVSYLTRFRLTSLEAAQAAIDFNVLVLLTGMMAIVGVMKSTGGFEWAVARLLRMAGHRPARLVGMLAAFTALVSAFADNVTTVVFVTPLALQLSRRIGLPAPALLLPVVMASNIGGTATLIGDPPNILIGSGAHLTFIDFLDALTPPILVAMLGLGWFTRRRFGREMAAASLPRDADEPAPPITDPTLLKAGLAISLLVFVGFLTHARTGMPAAVPAAIGAALLLVVQDVLHLRHREPTSSERIHGILLVIEREIEWPTLAFFAFLFVIVGAAVGTGLIDTIADLLRRFIDSARDGLGLGPSGTLLFTALFVLWTSGILSALVDNIPFVAVMIPVIATLIGDLTGGTTALWWALSLGACLGGNGTLIGASANVTVVGLAERMGIRIGFAEFARFGTPVAAMTLVIASAYLAAFVLVGPRPAQLGMLAVFGLGLAARAASSRRTAGASGPR